MASFSCHHLNIKKSTFSLTFFNFLQTFPNGFGRFLGRSGGRFWSIWGSILASPGVSLEFWPVRRVILDIFGRSRGNKNYILAGWQGKCRGCRLGPGSLGTGPLGLGPLGPGPLGPGPLGPGPLDPGPLGSGPLGPGLAERSPVTLPTRLLLKV